MNTFSGKNAYYQEKFTNISIEEQTISSKEFEECVFTKCSFIDTTFNNCKFIDCKFFECSISAMKIPNCKVVGASFSESKVIGIDWTKAIRIENMNFDTCQINYSNFSYLKLPKLAIVNCVANDVDFIETDLTAANLSGTDFTGARFLKTNLSKADLRSAKNYLIDIKTNIVTKASFTFPEVMGLLAGVDVQVEY